MNIQEAAEFLGRTTRAVQRYKAQGKLSARPIKVKGTDNKTREVLDFDKQELAKLKEELDNPTKPLSPQVTRLQPETAAPPAGSDVAAIVAEVLIRLQAAGAFDGRHQLTDGQHAEEGSPILTLEEASRFLKTTPYQVRKAVRQGKLAKVPLGPRGALRFKLDDLTEFVKRL